VLADTMKRVLDGRATSKAEQEFYNSDCGMPHLPAGGYISPDLLDACIDRAYAMPDAAQGAVMGVDVGKRLHVTIGLPVDGALRLVYVDSVRMFEDVDALMHRYGVACCVIDANPETRLAQEFALRWNGRVLPAYYPNFAEGSRPDLLAVDETAGIVRIVRTAILDLEQAMVARRQIVLPRNARDLGGSVNQAGGASSINIWRVLSVSLRMTPGEPIVHFESNGPDHFATLWPTCLQPWSSRSSVWRTTKRLSTLTTTCRASGSTSPGSVRGGVMAVIVSTSTPQ
jgi:hypothetical protein